MPFLAGVLALTVAAAPLAVKADNQSNQPSSGQAQNKPRFAGVELTQQQKDQMEQIRRDTRAQIEQILTPQQREQFKTAMQNRQGGRAAFAAMNLSPEQQTQMRTIMQSSKSRAEAVLTVEQRQQIQKYRQERRQQRNSSEG